MLSHILKSNTNELVYKTERDSQTQKTNMATKGESRGKEGLADTNVYT